MLQSFSQNFLLSLLRKSPWLYKSLRFLFRFAVNLSVDFFRAISPRNSLFGPPKGYFSDVTVLRDKKIQGRIILPCQKVPAIGRDSLRKRCGLGQDCFQPWPIFWSHHSKARLVGPTLVLLNQKKQASLEAMYNLHCYKNDPGYRYLKLPPPVRLEGNWTSVVSMWSQGFYHWFADVLPRLALLSEFPSDTRIITPPLNFSYEKDTLKLLGLEQRIRPTFERHLIVEDFYFSSPTAMTGCYDPFAIDCLRWNFLKFADESFDSPRRFYVGRVGKTRGVINEQQVLDEMARRGWGIVDCEQLSMAQQIKLFSNAEAVCALHGAALTNLIWCRPGCRVFELVAENYSNGVFEGIAEIVGLHHRYLMCEADSAFRAFVPMDQFKPFLDGETFSHQFKPASHSFH